MTANDKIKAVAKAVLQIVKAIHADHRSSCGQCPYWGSDVCYDGGSATTELEKIINNER